MNSPVESDLNQVIANAVTARIEAQVAAALSGSELVGQYVTAALSQPITVRDPHSYRDRKTTFLKEAVDKAMKDAAEAAVRKVIAEEQAAIEERVREELRARVDVIATQLVGSVVGAAEKPYGITVALNYPSRD